MPFKPTLKFFGFLVVFILLLLVLLWQQQFLLVIGAPLVALVVWGVFLGDPKIFRRITLMLFVGAAFVMLLTVIPDDNLRLMVQEVLLSVVTRGDMTVILFISSVLLWYALFSGRERVANVAICIFLPLTFCWALVMLIELVVVFKNLY